MCGILLAFDRDPMAIGKGLQAMSYRGHSLKTPTMAGAGRWAIGHVHLPIQTKWGESIQPFQGPSQEDIFAFAGEIFSEDVELGITTEEEILRDLIYSSRAPNFHTLDGFWSVVSARAGRGAIALSDHLGIKPLYYWEDERLVCSEIDPMFQVTEYFPKMDEVYLSNCIKFGYDFSGRTPWQGIRQLPPGVVLFLDEWGYKRSEIPYWNWDEVATPVDLTQALRESVRNRVMGVRDREETPVGMLLSGGLDSTIIYTLARQEGLPLALFSVENGEDENFLPEDEVINMLPAFHQSEMFLPLKATTWMQAPMDLGSLYPQVQMSEALGQRKINVVLTGDGADELFGGYRRAKEYDSQYSDVFCELPYYHLPRLDRIHMRSTTEVRSPYLAPGVVRYALSLHRSYRTEKQALKEVAKNIGVPDEIIQRPKLPLKSPAVLENGIKHRIKLVEAFRERFRIRH